MVCPTGDYTIIRAGSIKPGEFRDCSGLTSVTIPKSVTSITFHAFAGCTNLASVSISDSVTTIDACAFENCSSLTSVTIGKNLKSVGSMAFYGCTRLSSIVYTGLTAPNCGTEVFSTSLLAHVNVPLRYKDVTFCGQNTVKNVLVDDVSSCFCEDMIIMRQGPIYEREFSKCTGLTSVTIGDSVTSINSEAFCDCKSLHTVTIGNGVTSIGPAAFRGCKSLLYIPIPASVVSIAEGAFLFCSSLKAIIVDRENPHFTSISGVLFSSDKTKLLQCPCKINDMYRIPSSVRVIGRLAFATCTSLTDLIIPKSVTHIEREAFMYCARLVEILMKGGVAELSSYTFYGCQSLRMIILSGSLCAIGENAFGRCSSLTEIYVDSRNKNFTVVDNVLFSYDKKELVLFPAGLSGTYTVPSYVEQIHDYAFSNSSLSLITFGQSITFIGDYAFSDSSNLSIKYSGVKEPQCGSGVFAGTSVWSIYVPADYTSDTFCGRNVIRDVAKKEMLSNWVIQRQGPINDDEFRDNKNITTLVIGDDVTYIGNSAFKGCPNIRTVTIGNSVTGLGGSAFGWCDGLTSVHIGTSVKELDTLAFYCCKKLVAVTGGEAITHIGNGAFGDCESLKLITLGKNLTTIYGSAFSKTGLTSITLPASTTSIGGRAFYDSESLVVHVNPRNRHFICQDDILFSFDKSELIFCPRTFAGDYVIPDTVKTIGEEAFVKNQGLTSVVLPNSVTTIGISAFDGCTRLTRVTIPDSVKTIGSSAFRFCSNLILITIGKGVTHIANDAFGWCGITSITLPASLVSMPDNPFVGCISLTKINVEPRNTKFTSIGGILFSYDTLTLVAVPGSLRNYTVPDFVTKIGRHAFCGNNITEVIIPASVKHIESWAFSRCSTTLTSVTYLGLSPPDVSTSAFDTRHSFFGDVELKVYVPSGYSSSSFGSEKVIKVVY